MANWTITKEIRPGVAGQRILGRDQVETPFMLYGYATFTSDAGEVVQDATWGDGLTDKLFASFVSKRLASLISRDAALATHQSLSGEISVEPYVEPVNAVAVADMALQVALRAKQVAQLKSDTDPVVAAAASDLEAATNTVKGAADAVAIKG